jgi:hypothetical protein
VETGQPQQLLGLLVLVAASLALLVYVILRMAGVHVRRHGGRAHHRPR